MKRKYVINTIDLYDEVLWPHLAERLPNGIKEHTHTETNEEGKELAAKILDDFMSIGFNSMVKDGSILVMPCFKTGYMYIKDQKNHYKEDYYKYDIDLDGAFYQPVFIMDSTLRKKVQGYYNILIPLSKLKEIKQNAKNGVRYNDA